MGVGVGKLKINPQSRKIDRRENDFSGVDSLATPNFVLSVPIAMSMNMSEHTHTHTHTHTFAHVYTICSPQHTTHIKTRFRQAQWGSELGNIKSIHNLVK